MPQGSWFVVPLCLLCAAAYTGLSAAAWADSDLPGPIPAALVRVIDGDTIEVRARIWLDLDLTTRVRLAGIDAPELNGACPEERRRAEEARARRSSVRKLGSAIPRSMLDMASVERSTRSASSSWESPRRFRANLIRCPTRRLSVIPGEFSGSSVAYNVVELI